MTYNEDVDVTVNSLNITQDESSPENKKSTTFESKTEPADDVYVVDSVNEEANSEIEICPDTLAEDTTTEASVTYTLNSKETAFVALSESSGIQGFLKDYASSYAKLSTMSKQQDCYVMLFSKENVEKHFKFVATEGDLYRLISHSKLPSAEKFESWIFDDVIPSIRKYGMYATDELLDNPDLIIKMATKLKEERELNKRLQEENEEKNKLIEKQKPKAEFYDEIIDSTTVIGMKEVADILNVKGYGRNNLFKFLREKGILNRKNEPYRKYIEQGLFEIKESKYIVDNEVKIKPTTYVTQKGLDYIRKILNK